MNDWTSRYATAILSLDRYSDLVNAVITIAGHRRPAIDIHAPNNRIESTAHQIRSMVPHLASAKMANTPRGCAALMAHLHNALFDDLGLGGDGEIALHPDASDFGLVLDTGRGLPIACALVYCAIAERLGLNAFGIDAPGHFLVGVQDGDNTMIIDAFGSGRLIDRREFSHLIHAFDEDANPDELIQPAPPSVWLERWLRNLVIACDRCGESHLVSVWTGLIEETSRSLGPK